jgi:hypothetical protein
MLKEDKNQNGKRTNEMNLTGNRARKQSKKRDKLQKVLEGTSQKKKFQNWNFSRISEQRHMVLLQGEAI